MALYQSTEGPIELYYLEFEHGRKKATIRVPEGQAPIARIMQLSRELKKPQLNQWTRLREAEGEEISAYVSKHPELKIRDMRFERKTDAYIYCLG